MVGCVIAQGAEIIGEGWHRRFGQAHAEVEALQIAGDRAAGATLYVTLEPCCHHGKTPPCTQAVLASGVRRVVVAARDPFPQVQGGGIAELRAAGLAVERGTARSRGPAAERTVSETRGNRQAVDHRQMGHDARRQDRHPHRREPLDLQSAVARSRSRAPRPSRRRHGRTRNGRTGRSALDRPAAGTAHGRPRDRSRHAGIAWAATVNWCAPRAKRRCWWPWGRNRSEADRLRLRDAGCEVFVCDGETHAARLDALLAELGRRRLTNVLVEGGGRLLGSLLDARAIDEVHVFIAPKLVGGGVGRHGRRRPWDRRNRGGPASRIAASAATGRRHLHHGPMLCGFFARKSRGPRIV